MGVEASAVSQVVRSESSWNENRVERFNPKLLGKYLTFAFKAHAKFSEKASNQQFSVEKRQGTFLSNFNKKTFPFELNVQLYFSSRFCPCLFNTL